MQLPVRERKNFGQWLNVAWDDEVAVNLLAADPWCRIDAQPRSGYRLLQASAEDRVRTLGVTAALIVTPTAKLLDRIAISRSISNCPAALRAAGVRKRSTRITGFPARPPATSTGIFSTPGPVGSQ